MKYSYLILAMCFLMFSCQREEMNVSNQNEVVVGDPMIKVNGTVSGFVIDEQGEPVEDAMVSLGDVTRMTDEYGSFILVNQELFADGTYLTIEKPGYFLGSRRFNAIENEQNNVRIRLIEKNLVATISANQGGEIEFQTTKISLPAGDYLAEDGSKYTGEVSVFAKYLDPTKEETFEEMPGDLIGTDSEGALNALATFGMVAVELENDNGRKVNLPEGEKAILKIAVPEVLSSTAPSSIPLWHFDEEKGMWLEEGEAILEDDIYIGEVSHFSFWNCDYPFPLINISGSVNVNEVPANGLKIVISDQSTGFSGCGYTGSAGLFSGNIPEGGTFTLSVLDPCGSIMYEEEIGPYAADTDLGQIDIATAFDNVILSGLVSNCTGETINESSVILDFGNTQMQVLCEDDGTFEFLTPNCVDGTADIYGIDLTNSLVSPPASINLTGTQDVGTLIACEESIQYVSIVEYDNKNWGSTLDSTLLGYTIEIDSFINGTETQIVLKYNLIDWTVYDPNNDGLKQYVGTYTYNLGDDTAEVYGAMESQGFSFNGTSSYEEINQAGSKFVRFNISTTDVQIDEPSLYPGDVGEVEVYLTLWVN